MHCAVVRDGDAGIAPHHTFRVHRLRAPNTVFTPGVTEIMLTAIDKAQYWGDDRIGVEIYKKEIAF